MGYIAGILIVATITWGIYKLFELFVRKKERLTIIDKLGERFSAEDVKKAFDFPIFPQVRKSSFTSLKASLLLIGIGTGLIVSFLLQYHFLGVVDFDLNQWQVRENINEFKLILNFSGVSIFGGLGLFIAYLIESRKSR